MTGLGQKMSQKTSADLRDNIKKRLANFAVSRYAPPRNGRLAQLVERFVYTEDVGGSSPSSPTIPNVNYTKMPHTVSEGVRG
jgi:hypothetical protein